MDTHFKPGDNSGQPLPTRLYRRHVSSNGTQNLSLRDRFDLDRPQSSRGDNNHNMRNHVSNPSHLSSGNHSKRHTRSVNTADNDEIVKHMSNLPSFLEPVVKPQEKAFNVGVLDWGLLEKWQSSKRVLYRSDGSSSSKSNSSSLFSTEEPSTYSPTGHSSAAFHQRHRHCPSEACTSNGKFRNDSKYQSGSRADSSMKETTFSSKSKHLAAHDASFSLKGQCHGGLEKQARRSKRSQSMSLNHKFTEKNVLVRPLDDCATVFVTKGLKATTSQRNLEEKEMNCNGKHNKAHNSEISRDIPHSCPLPCDVKDQKIGVLRPSRSEEDKKNYNTTADGSQMHSTGKHISPLKEGSSKYDHPVTETEIPTVADLPQESRISKPLVDAANAKYPSRTDRFSLPIGTPSRKSSTIEDAESLQASSTHAVDKPYTMKAVYSSSIEKLSCDKSAAADKARSSPLKRLLEPLLKPREATNNRSSASLKRDSKPVKSASKMLDRPSTAPRIRVGLNLNSDKSTGIHKPHQNGKHNEPAVIQALLQVVVQNGCPLFTFAVDSINDILCAALSKLSTDRTSKDMYLYTFFSIQEIKNRSWMNLRGKGCGHDYSPNVIAQMEVSETRLLKPTGNNFVRQFVLSTVDLKPGEKSKSEYQLNDELATVVVGLPRETDEKMQLGKYYGTTVILPGGIHTLPVKGKPSSLIERWRSGGQCDCGGWDPGCKLRILTDSKCQPTSSVKFKLYDQGGVEGKQQPALCLAPFKDKEGVLSISFSSSISPLQAFSICLAVLDSRKLLRSPTPTKIQEAKSSDPTSRDEVPGSYFSVPPLSPVGRA